MQNFISLSNEPFGKLIKFPHLIHIYVYKKEKNSKKIKKKNNTKERKKRRKVSTREGITRENEEEAMVHER
jgi:hypothetical protein